MTLDTPPYPKTQTVSPYLKDELTDDERYDMESHLMGCVECRGLVDLELNNQQ